MKKIILTILISVLLFGGFVSQAEAQTVYSQITEWGHRTTLFVSASEELLLQDSIILDVFYEGEPSIVLQSTMGGMLWMGLGATREIIGTGHSRFSWDTSQIQMMRDSIAQVRASDPSVFITFGIGFTSPIQGTRFLGTVEYTAENRAIWFNNFGHLTGPDTLVGTIPIPTIAIEPPPEPPPPVLICEPLDIVCHIHNWFNTSVVNTLRWLFVPSQVALQQFAGIWDTVAGRVPLGYFALIRENLQNITEGTGGAYTIPSIPIFGTIRTSISILLWVFFGFWLIKRIAGMTI